MNPCNPAKEVERLLQFAQQQHMINDLDVILSRNLLFDLLQINEPYSGEIPKEELDSPIEILSNLLDYAADTKLIPDNTTTYRDLLDAKIMGILMPRQSESIRTFWDTAKNEGIEKATENFYKISQASNYIRMDRIAKNLYWRTATEYGALEITINLSKPEKDPKEIALAKATPQSNYPKCLLCIENVGYAGHINHPARQNHRIIPVTMGGEQFYFQYSPYVYYNEHCILLHKEHVPMKISEKTFESLFSFIEQFPHYFIGSNADLPIVGGSILTHEHYQGGNHSFPMAEAEAQMEFLHPSYPNSKAAIVKWPMSVIRLAGENKEELIEFSIYILEQWKKYSDPSVDILAYSTKENETIPHNTITPIVRKNKQGEFEIDLVLRNNRTSEQHPDGVFHPHEELHHIKKENIGLIEVMGLAVLPGRLNVELKEIEKLLTGEVSYVKGMYSEKDALYKHVPWIEMLMEQYGTQCSKEEARENVEKEVGLKFSQVLEDAGVFKKDEKGTKAFIALMNAFGFELK